jgi:hypothetical protein
MTVVAGAYEGQRGVSDVEAVDRGEAASPVVTLEMA